MQREPAWRRNHRNTEQRHQQPSLYSVDHLVQRARAGADAPGTHTELSGKVLWAQLGFGKLCRFPNTVNKCQISVSGGAAKCSTPMFYLLEKLRINRPQALANRRIPFCSQNICVKCVIFFEKDQFGIGPLCFICCNHDKIHIYKNSKAAPTAEFRLQLGSQICSLII